MKLGLIILWAFAVMAGAAERSLPGSSLLDSVDPADRPSLMNRWSDDFSFDHENFCGDWSKSDRWDGTLCEGRSYYRGQIGGRIAQVKFKIEDGYIQAVADLKDVWGYLEGSYRSSLSACTTLSGWVGLSSDWAHLVVNVHLNPAEVSPQVKGVEVVETVLGRLHFGLWLPGYLERHATDLSNWALAKVWASEVGEWINQKLTQEIGKKRKDSRQDPGRCF